MVLGAVWPPDEPVDEAMYRILIVSDDLFLREMIRLTLSGLNAEVRCVETGDALWRLTHRVVFDLVVLLGSKPFLCRDDAVRRLRPEGLRRPLIYVLTWQQSEQTVLGLLECGADQYFTFPINLQRLRVKVANELCRS